MNAPLKLAEVNMPPERAPLIQDCSLFEKLLHTTVQIPLIQRPYDWKPADVEAFCDDIVDYLESGSSSPHYIGLIRCAQTEPDGPLLVTDGQQRITTFVLVVRAMWDLAHTAHLDDDLRAKVISTCAELLRHADTSPTSLNTHAPRVRHSFAKLDQFLTQVQLLAEVEAPAHAEVKGAYKAYQRAQKWLRAYAKRDLAGLIRWFFTLRMNVRVSLEVQPSLSGAERGFVLANCRGVEVSDAHLLRAMLLGTLPGDSPDRLRFDADWETGTATIVDAGANIDKFLRTFAAVKYPTRDFKGAFAPKFVAAGAAEDVVAFGAEMREAAAAYARIYNGERPTGGLCAPLVDTLAICATNDAGNALALILAARHADPDAFDRLAHTMFTYQLVKRVVAANRDRTAPFLAKFLPSFAQVRTVADAGAVAAKFTEALAVEWGADTIDALTRRPVKDTEVARMLLGVAEDALQAHASPRFAPTAPISERYSSAAGVDVEHILCQSLTGDAVEEFGTSAAEAELWVWHIGNLALLRPSENSSLGSKTYLHKRDLYRRSQHLVTALTAGRERTGADTRLDRLPALLGPAERWDSGACARRSAQLAELICGALGVTPATALRLAV